MSTNLTAVEMEILEFERTDWGYDRSSRYGFNSQGRKETAVSERFGFGLTSYYQLLNQIIDKPAATVYDPQLVNRLRRVRDEKTAGRTGLSTRSVS